MQKGDNSKGPTVTRSVVNRLQTGNLGIPIGYGAVTNRRSSEKQACTEFDSVLLVLGLLAVLGRIVGQRGRGQLHLPGVDRLRSGVDFIAGNSLRLSRVGSAEVLAVGTQIVTIRSQVLSVRVDVALICTNVSRVRADIVRVGADGTAVLRNVLPVHLDVALIRADGCERAEFALRSFFSSKISLPGPQSRTRPRRALRSIRRPRLKHWSRTDTPEYTLRSWVSRSGRGVPKAASCRCGSPIER
jgi:hypothetical protein